jgi:ArsR family transcriptional regulator
MTSKHVALLRDAGLLDSRKEGSLVYYQVATPCLAEFFLCLDRSITHTLERRQQGLERSRG